MCVVAGHPERLGKLGTLELVPEVQLNDLAVVRVEPDQSVMHEPPQLRSLGIPADIGRFVGHVRHLIEAWGDLPAPQPTMALIACDGVKPGPQLAGIAKLGELGRGDDERVLHGVGSVRRLPQHGTAIGIKGCRVAVVRFGKPGRVSGHDSSDNLTVLHANTVVLFRLKGQI